MSQKLSESFEWSQPYIEEYRKMAEGGRLFRVRALHVTMTGNRRKYTLDELRLAGRSLSDRPIGLNHKLILPYPENQTLDSEFNEKEKWVETLVKASDPMLLNLFDAGKIKHVSIEGRARDHREIDGIEPIGVTFTGLTFVTDSEIPGDPLTTVELMETVQEVPLSEIMAIGEPFAQWANFAACVADISAQARKRHPEWSEERIKNYAGGTCHKIEQAHKAKENLTVEQAMELVEKEFVQSDTTKPDSGSQKEIKDVKKMVENQKTEPTNLEEEPIKTIEELLDTLPDEAFENIEEVKKWLQKVRARMVKKGTVGAFTAAAKKAGMSVAAYARKILANKSKYSTTMIKRAVFALRAQKGFKDTVDDEFINEVLAKPLDDDSDLEITSEEQAPDHVVADAEIPPVAPPVMVEPSAEVQLETKDVKVAGKPKPPTVMEVLDSIKRRGIENDMKIRDEISKQAKVLREIEGSLTKSIEKIRGELIKAFSEMAVIKAGLEAQVTKIQANWDSNLSESKKQIESQTTKLQEDWNSSFGESKKQLIELIQTYNDEVGRALEAKENTIVEQAKKVEAVEVENKQLKETVTQLTETLKQAEDKRVEFTSRLEETNKLVEAVHEAVVDRNALVKIPFKGAAVPTTEPTPKIREEDWQFKAWKRKAGLK